MSKKRSDLIRKKREEAVSVPVAEGNIPRQSGNYFSGEVASDILPTDSYALMKWGDTLPSHALMAKPTSDADHTKLPGYMVDLPTGDVFFTGNVMTGNVGSDMATSPKPLHVLDLKDAHLSYQESLSDLDEKLRKESKSIPHRS